MSAGLARTFLTKGRTEDVVGLAATDGVTSPVVASVDVEGMIAGDSVTTVVVEDSADVGPSSIMARLAPTAATDASV